MTRPSPKHIQPSKHRKLLAEEDRAPSLRPFGSVRPPKEKDIFFIPLTLPGWGEAQMGLFSFSYRFRFLFVGAQAAFIEVSVDLASLVLQCDGQNLSSKGTGGSPAHET
jgi:hypothetical protein